MMIIKEAFGWSDSQLFEQCQFNLLVRSALGLVNVNDPLPAESTYYLLRKRIYEYNRLTGEDLLEKTFVQITREQIKQFDVNGRKIRMDSKLIGSNLTRFAGKSLTKPYTLAPKKKLLPAVFNPRMIQTAHFVRRAIKESKGTA